MISYNKKIKNNSLRSFGLIWSLIFFVFWARGVLAEHSPGISLLIVFIVFVALSFFVPRALEYPYQIWIKIGDLIGHQVSKLVLLIIFFVLFTPIAILLKIISKDILKLSLHRNSDTYWENRDHQFQSMKNQF